MTTRPNPHPWHPVGREQCLRALTHGEDWDLVVIGGGITGAGAFHEAARQGLRVLLVERKDFAWGTSSRSSQMVHGGLRYLSQGDVRLVRQAVRQRERLLRDAPGLVEPLPFVMPHYGHRFPGRRSMHVLLGLYDRLGGSRHHGFIRRHEAALRVPGLKQKNLRGLSWFMDAVTDDARLVFRLLDESLSERAWAMNYLVVEGLEGREDSGYRVRLRPAEGSQTIGVRARTVINASGAWIGQLKPGKPAGKNGHRIRPLRGSHLVFPYWALPVPVSLTFHHPRDRRPVFAFPWQGMTVVGTTDLDHDQPLDAEPRITPGEVDYLMSALRQALGEHAPAMEDIQACWSGIRPVISSGKQAPSREKRHHDLWEDQGVIHVAGGKLTTFHPIARQLIRRVARKLRRPRPADPGMPLFRSADPATLELLQHEHGLGCHARRRLAGRFGHRVRELVALGPFERIEPTNTRWVELEWTLRHESVMHLDDLLLRRTRLGLILPDGGETLMPRLQDLCQQFLGWDKERWEHECDRYRRIWLSAHAPPLESSDSVERSEMV